MRVREGIYACGELGGACVREEEIEFFGRIHVEPWRNEAEGLSRALYAVDGLRKDPRRAPFDLRENLWRGLRDPDEIVAAICAGAQNDVLRTQQVKCPNNMVRGKRRDVRADENGCGCPRVALSHQRVVHAGAEIRPRLGDVLPSVAAKGAHLGFRIGRIISDHALFDFDAFGPFQHIAHKRGVEGRDLLGCIARLQARFNGTGDWIFDKDDERFHGG